MLYREAGQFKASYAEDARIFPIRQDRIGFWALMLSTLFFTVSQTWVRVQVGCLLHTAAATLATSGVAIEVPLNDAT